MPLQSYFHYGAWCYTIRVVPCGVIGWRGIASIGRFKGDIFEPVLSKIIALSDSSIDDAWAHAEARVAAFIDWIEQGCPRRGNAHYPHHHNAAWCDDG